MELDQQRKANRVRNVHSLYLDGIRDGDLEGAIASTMGATYRQHSTGVRDGADGFREFFTDFFVRNPIRDIEIVRTLVDDDHVFVHAVQRLGDGVGWITSDLFAFDDNDRIVEHWDVISAMRAPNPAGRTQIDGTVDVRDRHLTDSNVERIRSLLTEAWSAAPTRSVSEFISADTYLQHNPDVPDGLDALLAVMEAGRRTGVTLHYERIHQIIGEGNFVATLAHQVWNGTDYAAFDLFRLDHGMVVEHWDNVEVIPPQHDWANSGKF